MPPNPSSKPGPPMAAAAPMQAADVTRPMTAMVASLKAMMTSPWFGRSDFGAELVKPARSGNVGVQILGIAEQIDAAGSGDLDLGRLRRRDVGAANPGQRDIGAAGRDLAEIGMADTGDVDFQLVDPAIGLDGTGARNLRLQAGLIHPVE